MALSVPIVVTPLIASSCAAYNVFDLSTWDNKHKQVLINVVLSHAPDGNKQWYNDKSWDTSILADDINFALTGININFSIGDNITYTWAKIYHGTVKEVLASGATAIFVGHSFPSFEQIQSVKGKMTITFKGEI